MASLMNTHRWKKQTRADFWICSECRTERRRHGTEFSSIGRYSYHSQDGRELSRARAPECKPQIRGIE